MNIYIIIPAHNEQAYLSQTLNSLLSQTLLPKKVVVVNDGSRDGTQEIIEDFMSKSNLISSVFINESTEHAPGSKVINAFYGGFDTLDDNYDVICKFDADLIFPKNYLERISLHFKQHKNCGMVGGFCYIEKNGEWILENLTNKDHIRGALKAYSKDCFREINGLRRAMGWDTVDELIAQFHGWNIITDNTLSVKHLKPTGNTYNKTAKHKQGQAFYTMRYGKVLTHIASAKLALKKRKIRYYIDCIKGFQQARRENVKFIVSEEEGKFIRKLRWKNIRKKLF